jgi:methanethiol S-methyltransferase
MHADSGTPTQPAAGPATVAFAWTGAALFAVSLGWFFFCYFVRFGQIAPPGSVASSIASDVLLFSVFAAHHSLLARTGIKRWLQGRVSTPLERSLYTWTASLLFLAVCSWWQPVPGLLYTIPFPWSLAGYAIQAVGVALTIAGAAAVDALDLAGVRPALLARHGQTARHVPLKTRGVYGFVRHPLYAAWAMMVFGTPTMTGTRASFAVISTVYLAAAIPWEERALNEVFGPEYEAYRRTVRWRMVPFLY